ncbi:MAG: hypothetical protein KGQ83_09885 [Planctomycetes bacterium]|nr:hypothetical protein [Planctomycetota bacterium]
MQALQKFEFEKRIAALAELHNREMTDVLMNIYWEALKDLSYEDFNRTANEMVRASKFFPKPAEFIEMCEKERQRRLEAEPPSKYSLPANTEELIEQAAMGSSALGKAFAANTLALLRGEIDKKTWGDRQVDLLSKLPVLERNDSCAMLLNDPKISGTKAEAEIDELLGWHRAHRYMFYRELKFNCTPETPKPRHVPHEERFQWRHSELKKINTPDGWGIACEICGMRVH